MPTIADAASLLQRVAPLELAEDWDNVGLLVGDPSGALTRVVTCLTVTARVVEEATRGGAELVVSHHPLPFRPLDRVSTDRVDGGLVWRLARAGVALYSAHTAYDSAEGGINDQLAAGIGLEGLTPLVPASAAAVAAGWGRLGAGRVGRPPAGTTVGALVARCREFLTSPGATPPLVRWGRATGPQGEPPIDRPLTRVAVACGSGASMLGAASSAGCDGFVAGEATLHDCLRAEALGVSLILVGHHASERFAMESLAERLAADLAGVSVWASRDEGEPLEA
ncbi:MAG: Nif3-like dinuclear metal center hexameric protein [Lacipirellulaceae bacterium]